jgi:PKD repeat protein
MRRSAAARRLLVAIAALGALAGSMPAFASPPANDLFANADQVPSLPYTDSGDLNGTGTEPGEFQFFNCSPMQQTVWYRLPASGPTAIRARLDGSDPGVLMNVWVDFGGGLGSLGFVGCTFAGGSVQFSKQPGGTYYIQAGSMGFGSANLQLQVEAVPGPPNDDFVNATAIGPRPYVDNPDLTVASVEMGEPTLPADPFNPVAASVWYTFTPDFTETLTATAGSCCVSPILAVYTGNSVQGLTLVAARSGFGQPVTFQAVAGTPYHFQLGRGQIIGGTAPMSFRLEPTPPPFAQFFFFPFDPSIFDTVQFQDMSFDPGQIGIASQEWQFGDGTNGTGFVSSHRYAADGDYTVDLLVTTFDGRSASASQVVHVRTHDIAITKFAAPTSARAGQTRELTIGVRNSLYPESVQFQLYKSVPGSGFQLMGTLTQLIPVRTGNKTVPVTLSYTFSNDDAAVGKVTFQAVATIMGARDALPADNTAIAPPTRVNR